MIKGFNNIYQDKKVFLTGHTGFKGSWLALWLTQLGAKVRGYALKPPTKPDHFGLLDLSMDSVIGDVNDKETLRKCVGDFQPDIIFHLAAQPLVRYSYANPHETFQTNVMGTVNVFEAARNCGSVKAIVNVTSDKCYENKEREEAYKEDEPMGGFDPYSASKGCAELVTQAYQRSFFPAEKYGADHHILLVSVRAGNVIGGGDWAEDRLFPDIVKAISQNKSLRVRFPQAIRPWQHVLEPLRAYLMLGQGLLEGNKAFTGAWNIGPNDEQVVKVQDIIDMVRQEWQDFNLKHEDVEAIQHEAKNLKLDCTKARDELKWSSLWDIPASVRKTIDWYKSYYQDGKVISLEQLEEYTQ